MKQIFQTFKMTKNMTVYPNSSCIVAYLQPVLFGWIPNPSIATKQQSKIHDNYIKTKGIKHVMCFNCLWESSDYLVNWLWLKLNSIRLFTRYTDSTAVTILNDKLSATKPWGNPFGIPIILLNDKSRAVALVNLHRRLWTVSTVRCLCWNDIYQRDIIKNINRAIKQVL